jgi:hypothetical protein
MKLAHVTYLASAAGIAASVGCTLDPLVVVENDAGTTGNTSGARNGNTGDGADAGNGGDAGVCVPNGITFKLDVGTTDNVYFAGSVPPWPLSSLGCAGWLTISTAVASPWGSPAVASFNLLRDGCEIPCAESQPEPAATQSFTWDGSYYPVTMSSDPNAACDTRACTPPGSYVVTMCVGYAGPDAGHVQGAPTCQSLTFVWPPANPGEALVETTITPTPGGM